MQGIIEVCCTSLGRLGQISKLNTFNVPVILTRDEPAREQCISCMTRHEKRRSVKSRRAPRESGTGDFDSKELEHELACQGLYIKDITGDGNCLFRSFSDQLGEVNTHAQIRHDVVKYLRAHKDEYQYFVEEDYDTYLDRMANDGVYGDNLEIVAFSKVFDRPVKVYQPGMAYVVQPDDQVPSTGDMIHLAYFSWEHYASIRNRDGPHDGAPQIVVKKTDVAREVPTGPSDLETICLASAPGADPPHVRKLLKEFRGNVNFVVDRLLEEQDDPAEDEPVKKEEVVVKSVEAPAVKKRQTIRDKKAEAKKQQKAAARSRRLAEKGKPVEELVSATKTISI